MDAYPELTLAPSDTSYFSDPEQGLDPRLFDQGQMRSEIRLAILNAYMQAMQAQFKDVDKWSRVWIAGSGVSFQWSAARTPGDLDVLIGIDYIEFRQANPQYRGWSNVEVSKEVNGLLRTIPDMSNTWDVTFYNNVDSWDIRTIKPYAAYDLVNDEWTVPPSPEGAKKNPYWDQVAARDTTWATVIANHYSKALTDLHAATNPAHRLNAETRLKAAIEQASVLYEDIHEGRKGEFSRVGDGYAGWGNYRWQAGKASGTVQAMRLLHDYHNGVSKNAQAQTYGLELPDTETLIRRAASRRAQ